MRTLDEAELITIARCGDEAAFRQLVGPHLEKVRRHVGRLLRDEADADDVLQDVLVKAWLGLGRFEGRCSMFTWLYRIGHNAALNFLYGERKHRALPLPRDTADADGMDAEDRAAFAHVDSPDGILEAKQRLISLQKALRALPRERRIPFERCVLDGDEYREAAAALRLPVGTVRSRIHRAREELGLLEA